MSHIAGIGPVLARSMGQLSGGWAGKEPKPITLTGVPE